MRAVQEYLMKQIMKISSMILMKHTHQEISVFREYIIFFGAIIKKIVHEGATLCKFEGIRSYHEFSGDTISPITRS